MKILFSVYTQILISCKRPHTSLFIFLSLFFFLSPLKVKTMTQHKEHQPIIAIETPLGRVGVVANAHDFITNILWSYTGQSAPNALLKDAARQIISYFNGGHHIFDLPLQPKGTVFQKRVYHAMQDIPFGTTQTYGQIAKTLKTSARAVGNACGANPLPIITPCHRVTATDHLGGYSWGKGLETKIRLLQLEGYKI